MLGLTGFVGLGFRPLVDRVLSSGIDGERVADGVRIELRQQDEHGWALDAGSSCGLPNPCLRDRPLIANPDRNRCAVYGRLVLAPVPLEFARRFALAVRKVEARQCVVNRGGEPLVAKLWHPAAVVEDGRPQLVEILCPLGALLRLQSELIAKLHDPAGFDELVHHARDVLAELRALVREIFDEKVSDHVSGGADARVANTVVRKL